MPTRRRLQLAAVGLLLVAYSVLSHYSNSNPRAQDLGAALALAPTLSIAIGLIWRFRGAVAAVIAAAAAALLLHHYWPLLTRSFTILSLIQQGGFYAILALSFGLSLRKNHVPLCTQLADKIHGPLTVLEQRYTRRVTAAWAIFLCSQVATTLLLFEFAPLRIWSLFVNFCSLPLLLLMFAGEMAVRQRVLPATHQSGLIETLRVYFANPR
jgi:uncharacterized membrane protein